MKISAVCLALTALVVAPVDRSPMGPCVVVDAAASQPLRNDPIDISGT
jgi:hypothetical protein